MKNSYTIVIAVLMLCSLNFAQSKGVFDENRKKLTDSTFSTLVSRDLVGLAACIFKNGEIVWQGNFGWANLEDKVPVDGNTLFKMASVSKTVTGAALMQFFDKGKFKLDDDINKYIPFSVRNPNYPDIPITFKMLFSHSSSLSDDLPEIFKLFGDGDVTEPSLKELVKSFFDKDGKRYSMKNFSNNKPGEKFQYCNLNYVFIAYLVEVFSGKSFNEYCKENIFSPLLMNETSYLYKDINLNNHAFNYVTDNSTESKRKRIEHYAWPGYPDGGLHTSMLQYFNFITMLINNGSFNGRQILSVEAVKSMFTLQNVDVSNAPKGLVPVSGIGLIWHYLKTGKGNFFYHAGGGTGISSLVLIDPATKSGAFAVGSGTITPAVANVMMLMLMQ